MFCYAPRAPFVAKCRDDNFFLLDFLQFRAVAECDDSFRRIALFDLDEIDIGISGLRLSLADFIYPAVPANWLG